MFEMKHLAPKLIVAKDAIHNICLCKYKSIILYVLKK